MTRRRKDIPIKVEIFTDPTAPDCTDAVVDYLRGLLDERDAARAAGKPWPPPPVEPPAPPPRKPRKR